MGKAGMAFATALIKTSLAA
ncbi:uncharacterized protein G2W53_010208 [Senna tora]|uniref:Uncharacterized protein n=1 Tax=Senna tora TaxID=362788 RepID=A0A835C9D4_9FABA|nr:uncharacterized protein G2W53_010208 [Senna tora]